MAGSQRNSDPHGNGSELTQDGRIEARLARIVTTMDYVQRDVGDLKTDMRDMRTDMRDMRSEHRSDFRMLFSAMITMALGLAAMMAKVFNWL